MYVRTLRMNKQKGLVMGTKFSRYRYQSSIRIRTKFSTVYDMRDVYVDSRTSAVPSGIRNLVPVRSTVVRSTLNLVQDKRSRYGTAQLKFSNPMHGSNNPVIILIHSRLVHVLDITSESMAHAWARWPPMGRGHGWWQIKQPRRRSQLARRLIKRAACFLVRRQCRKVFSHTQ
eukprot:SAG31_NODE_3452_length_4253_cov_10.720270_5_plen_173_part_00